MPWFRCFLRGENFPGELIGEPGMIGFFTNRFVEASDEDEAETLALKQLRGEHRLDPPPGYISLGIARVYFEETVEVDPDEVPAQKQGLAFYPMQDDDAEVE